MQISELVFDNLDNVSQDSDEKRDTMYNILDENDMIEEEDEGAEYDDEDGGPGGDGFDEYGAEND